MYIQACFNLLSCLRSPITSNGSQYFASQLFPPSSAVEPSGKIFSFKNFFQSSCENPEEIEGSGRPLQVHNLCELGRTDDVQRIEDVSGRRYSLEEDSRSNMDSTETMVLDLKFQEVGSLCSNRVKSLTLVSDAFLVCP